MKEFVREFRDEWKKDRLGDVAAMMTYYAIFALFPMLIFLVTLGLLVVPPETLQEGVGMATKTMPGQAADILWQQVSRMQQAAGGGLAIGSAALALWGASRGSVSLGRALNLVYDKDESRPWWKVQLSGVLVTLGVAILLILALVLLVAGPIAGHFVADRFGLGGAFDLAWGLGRWVLAAGIVMLTWMILYRYLPDTRVPLRLFTPGAVAGVLAWIAISLLFALYVNNFGKYEKTYGALGAVIAFLLWLYLSNFAMLLGAEVNDVIRHRKDARRAEARPV